MMPRRRFAAIATESIFALALVGGVALAQPWPDAVGHSRCKHSP
jgi:hypothetical protein